MAEKLSLVKSVPECNTGTLICAYSIRSTGNVAYFTGDHCLFFSALSVVD